MKSLNYMVGGTQKLALKGFMKVEQGNAIEKP